MKHNDISLKVLPSQASHSNKCLFSDSMMNGAGVQRFELPYYFSKC